MRKLMVKGRPVGPEGLIIFGIVGYETVALAANAVSGRRVVVPITDMLGPMTHHPLGKIGVWLFLGWAWDHFYKRGEREIIARMISV
jgi:hypothetical protein